MGDFQANFRRPDSGIQTAEGNTAGARASHLEKKRLAQQKEFEQKKQKIQADHAHEPSMSKKFAGSSQATAIEKSFKSQTVGLVTAEQFKAAAAAVAQGRDLSAEAAAKQRELNQESAEQIAARLKAAKKARKKKLREKKKLLSGLSFAGEEEEADLLQEGEEHARTAEAKASSSASSALAATPAIISSKKNPSVDTSFLPDTARDERIAAERKRLEQEWKEKQETIKKEKLEIVYSYWDGSGHRRNVVVQKGDTVGDFLEQCRKALCREFSELRGVGAETLLYVKEDLIIPQDMTFYDLIVTKARGKSGPLFHFDVHDDVRVGAIDSRVEKDESHPGKVVERRWYERNKHIFPASRWEMYDPTVNYGKYTIHGGEVNKK